MKNRQVVAVLSAALAFYLDDATDDRPLGLFVGGNLAVLAFVVLAHRCCLAFAGAPAAKQPLGPSVGGSPTGKRAPTGNRAPGSPLDAAELGQAHTCVRKGHSQIKENAPPPIVFVYCGVLCVLHLMRVVFRTYGVGNPRSNLKVSERVCTRAERISRALNLDVGVCVHVCVCVLDRFKAAMAASVAGLAASILALESELEESLDDGNAKSPKSLARHMSSLAAKSALEDAVAESKAEAEAKAAAFLGDLFLGGAPGELLATVGLA